MTNAQTEKINGALTKTAEQKPQGLASLIRQSTKELAMALPSHLSAERLVRIALTSIRQNPEIAKCTQESFLGSLFVLAQIGIEPIAGRAYLLPFNNSKKDGNSWKTIKEVQAVIGYKGLIELFYRNKAALSIDAQEVHQNDDFDYEYGTDARLKHKPAMSNRGEVIGYYAVAKMAGGASVFKYMSREECLEHGKKHSKTFSAKTNSFPDYSPWAKEFDAMCKKTVLIQLSKLLPLSVEIQQAISIDETSRQFKGKINDELDLPDETSWGKSIDAEIVKDAPIEAEKIENKKDAEW